eukprot:6175939-Pleurochrysis_carterae.AAC.2
MLRLPAYLGLGHTHMRHQQDKQMNIMKSPMPMTCRGVAVLYGYNGERLDRKGCDLKLPECY